ncbi:MAG: hypothetical protein Q7W02_11280 [Candidatus Rokubacteria bacterium]|nr:hypothetical protein [Candidatus Rokubacteria bacterium]
MVLEEQAGLIELVQKRIVDALQFEKGFQGLPVSVAGKVNVYVCPKCGRGTVTIDRDEGTTPFLLRCRASGREGY